MNDKFGAIWSDLAALHTDKLIRHGPTALGVGWNSEESQFKRFQLLAGIFQQPGGFSVNDVGCGYGALLDFLDARYNDVRYTGCDVSAAMISAAQARHPTRPDVRFCLGSEPPDVADYAIASGLFGLRVGCSDAEWASYIESTIGMLDRISKHGFAFNALTIYSDPEKMRDELYYADPCALFDLCKRRYSRNVALLHDYDLYDFTILVRKHG